MNVKKVLYEKVGCADCNVWVRVMGYESDRDRN